MKPMSLICLLRVSKSQQQENTFKDSILETIYELILENAANESHKVYFPDSYIPCVIEVGNISKKSTIFPKVSLEKIFFTKQVIDLRKKEISS